MGTIDRFCEVNHGSQNAGVPHFNSLYVIEPAASTQPMTCMQGCIPTATDAHVQQAATT